MKLLDVHSFEINSSISYVRDGVVFFTLKEQKTILDTPSRLDVFLLIVCLSGKGIVVINSQCHNVLEGDVLICKPNDIFEKLSLIENFEGYLLCMSREVMLKCVLANIIWRHAFQPKTKPVNHLSIKCFTNVKLFVELLERKTLENEYYNREIILSIIQGLQGELLNELDCRKNEVTHIGQSNEIFQQFLALLTNAEIKSRSVSWYSQKLFITPKYLSQICKTVSGRTAMDWIKDYVVRDICFYLRYSHKSIKEIAEILGFPNQSFFGKYVRANIGISPSKYKNYFNNISP